MVEGSSDNLKGVECWKCGKHGHKKSECLKNNREKAMSAINDIDKEEYGWTVRMRVLLNSSFFVQEIPMY